MNTRQICNDFMGVSRGRPALAKGGPDTRTTR